MTSPKQKYLQRVISAMEKKLLEAGEDWKAEAAEVEAILWKGGLWQGSAKMKNPWDFAMTILAEDDNPVIWENSRLPELQSQGYDPMNAVSAPDLATMFLF